MYLKSLKIKNFRKFGSKNNVIKFVDSKESLISAEDINVAKAVSLIVGKNNSGKTTIINALDKIVNDHKFSSNDFNYRYLTRLIRAYKKNHFRAKPQLYFEITIGIDERNHDDIVNNFVPFMTLADSQPSDAERDFKIIIKYQLEDDEIFVHAVKNLIEKYHENEHILFDRFLTYLDTCELFKFKYYDTNDIEKNNFNIKNLIDIRVIKPNENQGERDLSKIYSKIIKNKFIEEGNPSADTFQEKIESFNTDITQNIERNFTDSLNEVINRLHDKSTLKVYLSANLSFEQLLNQLVRYQYQENDLYIPENQFGLGYRNLLRIIGELIDYIEEYPDGDQHSRLNLICIEEPEVFMHPQMQELFINHIKEAIDALLGNSVKKLNSQLIVSTHSAHILNSKVHTSNSFDNINYIFEKDNVSNVVNLQDSEIISSEKNVDESDEDKVQRAKKELNFVKKHIKFKASELFFADAIIFVEGITEEVLISYYLSRDNHLNKKYITIFNIDGAHGLVYHHLIKLLGVPTIVVTDLDIQRTEIEKTSFTPINNLQGRTTTNQTIVKYNQTENISTLSTDHFIDKNLYIAFQGNQIGNYYATSLEEALIRTNYDNDILNNTLYNTKRNTYLRIVGNPAQRNNLLQNSYELQRKLSNDKSSFANELLYQLSNEEEDENLPQLPDYISNVFQWLKVELALIEGEE